MKKTLLIVAFSLFASLTFSQQPIPLNSTKKIMPLFINSKSKVHTANFEIFAHGYTLTLNKETYECAFNSYNAKSKTITFTNQVGSKLELTLKVYDDDIFVLKNANDKYYFCFM